MFVFILREIAVSLTFFVLLYSLVSALVALGWRALSFLRAANKSMETLLFASRILPLAAAVFFTCAFVVPSFQLLEPRSINEGVGAAPLALGLCALSLTALGSFRIRTVQSRTAQVVNRWLEGARPLRDFASLHILALKSSQDAPPLTLVGVRKPRVLVSKSTIDLLSKDELQIAVKHEIAHMQSRDNFKKLLFRFCPFPGMAKLESSWSQAAELAADDAAVSNQGDAVDLAAALVKLSRLLPTEAAPACTVGFVTGSISTRVARLLAWDGTSASKSESLPIAIVIPSLLLSVGVFAILTYGPVLTVTHEVTEWLVR
jgi:Zn-dependent protease with chaperone function